MASPVKDAKLKAQQIWSGATVHARGKGYIRHQHPTNPDRFMLNTQVGGRGWHFGDGPFTEANEVDTAWVDADPILDAPWQKKMVLADYNAYAFREATHQFDQGQLIEYRKGDDVVNLEPQQLQWTNDLDQISPVEDPQAVSATINDDELKWADAYGSGIDFRWHTHTTSMAKYVDIDSLANLGSPPQFIIDGGNPVLRIGLIFQKSSGINIWVDGVEWDENPNNPQITLNNVEFRLASTGETLWVFRAPLGWDSGRYPLEPEAGTVYPSMRLRKSGPNLLVEILTPWSWLETANYPITLDATIDDDVDTGTDDGSITNTSDFNATGSTLYVGRGPGITNSRSWFLFGTISGLSGSTIDVSYITPRVNSNGTATKTNIFAEDAVSPNAPTSGADYDGITTTSASVPWDDLTNSDTPVNSPSINSIIQELADSYDPTTILILWKDDSSANNNYHTVRAYESSLDPCSIHIEYTEAGGEVHEGAATLAGVGSLTANGDTVAAANATLAGVGSLTAAGTNARFVTSTLAGVGSLTAAGSNARLATSTLSGVGTLSAVGLNARPGTATLSGVGSVSAVGSRIGAGGVTLAGVGSLAAVGTVYGEFFGTATLSGVGTLAAVGTVVSGGVVQEGTATLAGVGALAAIGENTRFVTTTLAGVGSLTAAGENARFGLVTMAGVGTLVADAQLLASATATLLGVGTLQAIGTLITTYYGTATLSCVGTLQAIGTLLPIAPEKAGGDDEKEKPKQYEYQKEMLDMEPVARPLDPAFALRQEQKSVMKANAVAEALVRQNEHEAARRVSAMLSREKADKDRADRRRASSLHNLAKAQIAKEAKAQRQAEINKVRKKSLKKARAAKKRKAKKK